MRCLCTALTFKKSCTSAATFADKVLADTIVTQKLSDSVVRPEEINPTERTVVSDEDWTNAVIKAPANTPFNRAVHNKIHFP